MKKNINRWKILLFDPVAMVAIILIVVHQSLIASSAFFLTRLIEYQQSGGAFKIYLILYILSMVIPFVPGCLSFVALEYWTNRAHKKYTNWFSKVVFGKADIYRNNKGKENIESMLSRNSFGIISSYISFIHNFITFSLNSALSMIVISFLLPANLVSGYAISLCLSVAIIFVLKGPIQKCAIDSENQLVPYGDCLGRIWDNVVLGNIHNFLAWEKDKNHFAKKYYAASNKLAAILQLGNLLLGLAGLIPTCYLIYHLIAGDAVDAALAAAVIVNLTRIFHILNSLSALIYQTLDWSAMNARVAILFDMHESSKAEILASSNPYGTIAMNGAVVSRYDVEIEKIKGQECGRFTIRGANGSGKSTFLLELKKALGRDALLLPANLNGLCWQSNYKDLSTGQRVLKILNEVSEIEGVKYLLLDEWDANLDTDNVQRIDRSLDELANHQVIVEIRH